ncbi:Uncharacterised protein [Bordetella pertussis]|nr:Uncharacterised protein [Bordetella pertussis]
MKSGRSSAMSASPLSSSFTGPENRSTSLTFLGRLRLSPRMAASPPHLRRPCVPSIFSISLPYISSSSGA